MNTWLALSLWRGMTVSRLKKMQACCGSLQRLFTLSKNEWLCAGWDSDLFEARISPTDQHVVEIADWAIDSNVTLLSYDDKNYPACLREISSPPILLYAKGNYSVLEKPQLAMVGSRKATPRALEMAYGLAKDLAAKGIVITSGLALGIDTAAHQGALSASGETVAVMANGLARVYPPSNQRLAADIAKKGVLISEQPPWMEPKATLFPRRNRIVSGLSQGVLVVQANKKSGSLITARLALEQNREVMAMPGESGSEEASGCHWLLKQGAALVENADDVYAAMGWDLPERIETTSYGRKNPPDNPFNEVENTLLACIDSTDTSLEMIYKRYSGDHCKVLSLLSQLELEGLVQRTIFGYCRC